MAPKLNKTIRKGEFLAFYSPVTDKEKEIVEQLEEETDDELGLWSVIHDENWSKIDALQDRMEMAKSIAKYESEKAEIASIILERMKADSNSKKEKNN